MTPQDALQTIQQALTAGIQLSKCQQCGCMADTLNHLADVLPIMDTNDTRALAASVSVWRQHMRAVQYACLGCEHCYPAVASNALALALPSLDQALTLRCEFQVQDTEWPAVVGEYFVLDKAAAVAVSTLASVQLAEALVYRRPGGLAIVGKTETENIGIDKVVKNVITNPALRYLIIAGVDPHGHQPGRTLLALVEHGVDPNGRVLGAPGKRPLLRNVSAADIQAFRTQVRVIDMIGCDNADAVSARINALSLQATVASGCRACTPQPQTAMVAVPQIVATDPSKVARLDKAGYFVILPLAERRVINVEHYAYDNTLLHVIEGTNARAICTTLLHNGWVTEVSHAAYLGRELTKAELSLQYGFKYTQDGA